MATSTTQGTSTGELPQDADAFEVYLSARTDIEVQARVQLEKMHIGDLRVESGQLNQKLQAFASTIAQSVERPSSLDEFLQELDTQAISREHDWRSVFGSIKAVAVDGSRQRGVVIKYMQFLSARKQLIDELIDNRTGVEETDVHTNVETYLALQARMRRRERQGDDSSPGSDEFVRLAVGNTVRLRAPRNGELEILLAGHQFKLIVAGPLFLRDLHGIDYELYPGRNVVGRHPDCEVVLPGDLRNVSRAHLVVERTGEDTINLTDLSSKGTFLPADLLLPPI